MSGRDTILEAKRLLREIPGAAQLSRDAFVTVCVEAAIAFLRGSSQSDSSSNHTNKGSATSVSGTSESVARSSAVISGEHEMCASRLVARDVERLRACVAREFRRINPAETFPFDDDAEAEECTTLPRAKEEAAKIVKGVLDGPYRRGEITRRQYSVTVLAVLEKLFPVAGLSPGAPLRGEVSAAGTAESFLDDAFEREVERLRRVLEEKFALDLSGAGRKGVRRGERKSVSQRSGSGDGEGSGERLFDAESSEEGISR